jgi:hypothetical protein
MFDSRPRPLHRTVCCEQTVPVEFRCQRSVPREPSAGHWESPTTSNLYGGDSDAAESLSDERTKLLHNDSRSRRHSTVFAAYVHKVLLNWNYHCMTHRTNINIELKKTSICYFDYRRISYTSESSSFIYLHLAIIMHLNLIIRKNVQQIKSVFLSF